jgi:D-glycero-D-manno-heptose 1,7-bisphosphate phosphatase
MNKKLIILDRDGVINYDSDNYIKSPEEWEPLPGSINAIATLTKAGYTIAIATNQSGLARKYFTQEILAAMHKKMLNLITIAGGKIAHIAYCPHGPKDQCSCRKPKPGLVEQISQNLNIPITTEVRFVGDSTSDMYAALNSGCTPVLVKTGKGLKSFVKLKQPENSHLKDIAVYNSLLDFVNTLVTPK